VKGENTAKRSFEDLDVWKMAYQLTVDVYKITKDLKDRSLHDQLCRSAVSIPSNIAEGFERGSTQEFIRFLYISKGSAGELRTQLLLAVEFGYISKENGQKLHETCRMVSSKTQSPISSLKNKVRDKNVM
jgi:four helix bundle protein